MKKRILSFVLVLCMLVALVPVTASVATAADEPALNAADFYVTDGLTALFTTFDEGTVNISAGTWTAYNDASKVATIVSGGFTLENGALAATKSVYTDRYIKVEGLLPENTTFTVEFAMDEGYRSGTDHGNDTNAFRVGNIGAAYFPGQTANKIRFFYNDTDAAPANNMVSGNRWDPLNTTYEAKALTTEVMTWTIKRIYANSTYTIGGWINGEDAWSGHGTNAGTGDGDFLNMATNLAATYIDRIAIGSMMEPTVYGMRVYSKNLSADEMQQNRAVDILGFYNLNYAGLEAAITEAGDAATFIASEDGAAVITAMLGLGYTSDKATAQAVLNAVCPIPTGGTTEPDPIEPDEFAQTYQDLYVGATNGDLVALFTAFGGESDATIDLTTGIWRSRINNKHIAAISGGAYSDSNPKGWTTGETGKGIGYRDQTSAPASNAISFDASLFASDDYTMEFIAANFLRDYVATLEEKTETVDGLTTTVTSSVNWNSPSQTARAALVTITGTANTSVTVTLTGLFFHGSSTTEKEIAIGTDGTYSFVASPGAAGSTFTVTLGAEGYTVDIDCYTVDAEAASTTAFAFGNVYSTIWTNLSGSNRFGNGFGHVRTWYADTSNDRQDVDYTASPLYLNNGEIQTWTYTKDTNGSNVSYKFVGGGVTLLDQTNIAGTADKGYKIAENLPMDIYTIRIYNRTLTDAEVKQNHFVDIAAFYGLDVTAYKAADDDTKTALHDAFADITFEDDADFVQAMYEFKLGNWQNYADQMVKYENHAPIVGGSTGVTDAVGYRVNYTVDKSILDVFETEGFTVLYGAIVGVGSYGSTTVNTVDGLTVSYVNGTVTTSNSRANVILVKGSDATGSYSNDFGNQLTYNATVLYNDPASYSASMIVRGFTVIIDGNGTATILYDDATIAPEVLQGAVSMKAAAAYFVNEFDGDLQQASNYMNSPALLEVLDCYGIEARTVLDADEIIYVNAATGNDANGGLSADNAVATLNKAYELAKTVLAQSGIHGVTIRLAEGTYRIEQTMTITGDEIASSNAYFHIEGSGEGTVITSTKPITSSWTADGNGNYYTTLPEGTDFRLLYQNGELMDLASTGDSETNFRTLPSPSISGTNVKFYLPKDCFLNKTTSDFAGAELHVIVEWKYNIMHIERVDWSDTSGSNVAVYVNYNEYQNRAVASTDENLSGRQYWVENHVDLGQTGQYYFDKNTRKLTVLGATSAPTGIEYPTLDNLLVFNDMKNVSISNLTLTGADHTAINENTGLSGEQSGRLELVPRQDSVTDPPLQALTIAAIYGKNVENVNIHNITVKNVGGDGISFRGVVKNVTIDSGKFEHIGTSAIRIGETYDVKVTATNRNVNILINNNYVNGAGEYFVQSPAILMTNGVNARILSNTVTNTSYTGISVGWKWSESTEVLEDVVRDETVQLYNVEIAYNYITNFMLCMKDGGAIYTLGGNAENSETAKFNFVHDNYVVITDACGDNAEEERQFIGYYHDGASSNWYDTNNVIINGGSNDVAETSALYYFQYISGQQSHNIYSQGNYSIGFARIYGRYDIDEKINTSVGHSISNYMYTGLSNLNSNTVATSYKTGTFTSSSKGLNTTAPSTPAKNTVGQIFLTAGSSLTPDDVKQSGGLTLDGLTANTKTYQSYNMADNEQDVATAINGMAAPSYTVTYMNEGTVFYTQTVQEGAVLELYASTPTKTGTNVVYTFAGWQGYTEGMKVFENITLTATYNAQGTFDVTYVVDGVAVKTETLDEGTVLVPSVENPTKDSDANYRYEFAGWDGYTEGMTLTANTTLTAIFNAIPHTAGDANGDGAFDANDVLWIKQIVSGARDNSTAFGKIDLNSDGIVNAMDVLWAKQIIAGTRQIG